MSKTAGLKDWNDLREVARRCLGDAIECLASIEIVERGNKPDAVVAMAKVGALQAAIHMRDATLFRLHVIVCRAYAPIRYTDDRHMLAAIEFLRGHVDDEKDTARKADLRRAVGQYDAIKDDPRLKKLTKMRDKLIAHITKPDPAASITTYQELFDITRATVEVWYALAKGAGEVTLDLDFFLNEYRDSLDSFWSRWSTEMASSA